MPALNAWCGVPLRAAAATSAFMIGVTATTGAVIYYGHLMTEDATIRALKVPLLGNFGGKDQGIPADSVVDFEKKAKAAGRSVDFKIYPESGHGFASFDTSHPQDARDANARTDAFFAKVLKGK